MQDRTSANSMKVLLQRTAGPYIRVIRVGSDQGQLQTEVRSTPKPDVAAPSAVAPRIAFQRQEDPPQIFPTNSVAGSIAPPTRKEILQLIRQPRRRARPRV
jgi:hypothetical protein